MRIDHLFLVAVKPSGLRIPLIGTRPRPDETPTQSVQRENFECKIVHDTRPWLLFAGDRQSADNWISTNRVAADRVRVVLRPEDVPEDVQNWQFAAVGHWRRRKDLQHAMIRLLMLERPVGAQESAALSCAQQ